MIEKFGRKGTECDGVFFTEGRIEGGVIVGNLVVESRRQNTSLDTLKQELAAKVRALGGNALDNFNYVQQGTVFSFSSTRWRASGNAVRVGAIGSEFPPPRNPL